MRHRPAPLRDLTGQRAAGHGVSGPLVLRVRQTPHPQRRRRIRLDHPPRQARPVHRHPRLDEKMLQPRPAHRRDPDLVTRHAQRPGARGPGHQIRRPVAQRHPVRRGLHPDRRPPRPVTVRDQRVDEVVGPAQRDIDPDHVGVQRRGDERLVTGRPSQEGDGARIPVDQARTRLGRVSRKVNAEGPQPRDATPGSGQAASRERPLPATARRACRATPSRVVAISSTSGVHSIPQSTRIACGMSVPVKWLDATPWPSSPPQSTGGAGRARGRSPGPACSRSQARSQGHFLQHHQ